MDNIQYISHILRKISANAVVIPILISIFKFKAFNKTLKVLFVYLLTILFFELGTWSDYIPYSAFTLLEYVCIFCMFYFTSHHKWIKIYFKHITFLFIVGSVLEIVFATEDYLLLVEYIFIISFALIFYLELLQNLNVPKLNEYPFFYFNTAFLIYFCGSFFIFLFSKQVISLDKTMIKVIMLFHSLLNILYLSLITLGIWKVSKK